MKVLCDENHAFTCQSSLRNAGTGYESVSQTLMSIGPSDYCLEMEKNSAKCSECRMLNNVKNNLAKNIMSQVRWAATCSKALAVKYTADGRNKVKLFG